MTHYNKKEKEYDFILKEYGIYTKWMHHQGFISPLCVCISAEEEKNTLTYHEILTPFEINGYWFVRAFQVTWPHLLCNGV